MGMAKLGLGLTLMLTLGTFNICQWGASGQLRQQNCINSAARVNYSTPESFKNTTECVDLSK